MSGTSLSVKTTPPKCPFFGQIFAQKDFELKRKKLIRDYLWRGQAAEGGQDQKTPIVVQEI